MDYQEHRINQGEGNLLVRDYPGSGPAYVALHGFPDNLHIFDEWAPLLAKAGRRVVTFDFLGFGQSDKSPQYTYSFAQQLTDLEAVVDDLNLDKIIPVAHDAGGPTAINFALKHPEKTASVCLFNCFYGSAPSLKLPEFIELFATTSLAAMTRAMVTDPKEFAWILNFQRAQFKTGLSEPQAKHYEEYLAPIIDQNFRQTPSAGLAFAKMTAGLFAEVDRNDARLAALKRLATPFQLVWGEKDPYLNLGVAQDLVAKLANAKLVTLSAGHWPQVDAPEDVARAMLAVD
jgi:pimeloyl-ACP methyl ester carboxylesterase